jgi:predicted nucleic acid-binding protein
MARSRCATPDVPSRWRTVCRLIDCLIAAVAIKANLSVLHADKDFDVLARHTRLRVEELERP